jgi:23S rRNA pseudouridine2605 synthase
MPERLQKYMAAAGIGSRRYCESLIRAGRVTVNGSLAELGRSVEPGVDKVLFDGRDVGGAERQVYVALNKPAGVLSSRRSQGGLPTVIDLVDVPQRVYPVGRLDADSEGLVLLTNDGDLTYRLTHPKFEYEKEYRVRLDRTPSEGDLQSWRAGIEVPELGRTQPAAVLRESTDGRWIRVVMHEGKNREIRRLAAVLGYDVERLIRLRIGRLQLGSMKQGEWRHLRPSEIAALQVHEDAVEDSAQAAADSV